MLYIMKSILYYQRFVFLFKLLLVTGGVAQAQSDTIYGTSISSSAKQQAKEDFHIDLDIRPRTEYRNGFRQLRSDSSQAAFFTSQRSRLNLTFKKDRFGAALSLQDVRIWGAANPVSTSASLQIFEAYVEPYFNSKLSLRLGKQKIMYDNQRLFAQSDWRQSGATHDAVNLRYYNGRVESELVLAFNQSGENTWFTNFAPIGFSQYKTLGVHYYKYTSSNEKWVLTSINYFEGFQQQSANNVGSDAQNFRYTDGGRITYSSKRWWLTFSGYLQHGHNPSGKTLSAFYFQPEIKYSLKKTVFRLGAEFKSGNNTSSNNADYRAVDHSFQYPHGVAHRFNGTMEYFTSNYVGSSKDVGLFDPYFFVEQSVNDKISFSLQNHFFFSQWRPMNAQLQVQTQTYLGFENDVLLTYTPNNYTAVDIGFSWLLASNSLQALSGGNNDYVPHWIYVQASFTPRLWSTKK